jgi:RsmE family RNA methyltransferase
VFHTEGKNISSKEFNFSEEVNLLIGPEGGWSPNEIEILKNKNFKIFKAGENILKTETACIVIPFLFSSSL